MPKRLEGQVRAWPSLYKDTPMHIKRYRVSIYSKTTHKKIDEVLIMSDGYTGALVDAAKYCRTNYQNARVGSVDLIVAP